MTLIYLKNISLESQHKSLHSVFLLHVEIHMAYMSLEGFNLIYELNIKFSSPHLAKNSYPSSWNHPNTHLYKIIFGIVHLLVMSRTSLTRQVSTHSLRFSFHSLFSLQIDLIFIQIMAIQCGPNMI